MSCSCPRDGKEQALSSQPLRSRNHLLSQLTQSDFDLLKPYLEPIDLPVRLKLEVPNKPVKHVYFPRVASFPLWL